MFGVLNINKPSGLTSHDVVARVRKTLNIKKVGHAGTLDPMATGVLPVYVGAATRLLEFAEVSKHYRCRIVFGVGTDTWDAEGEIEARSDSVPVIDEAKLAEVLATFEGEIEQRIPKYSAKKVNGKKLYELARAGQEVVLPTKKVTFDSVSLVELTADDVTGFPVAVVDVACGTGTFMRTLSVDVGEAFGLAAHLGGLVRTRHGAFALEDAVDLEAFQQSDDPQSYLQSPLPYLAVPVLTVDADNPMVSALCQGTNVLERHMITHAPQLYEQVKRQGLKNRDRCVLSASMDTMPIAVAEWRNHALKPAKVFAQV